MSRLLFHPSKRSAEKRPVMMDVHVVYTALMVFGCIVFRRVVCSEEDDPDIYFRCNAGYHRWKNNCYTLVMDRRRNWTEAQGECTDFYMKVAEPTTSSYNENIKATCRNTAKIALGNLFYIGLRKNSGENWRWESNNQPPKYTDWAPERPKNGDCVYLQLEYEPVNWRDSPCSQLAYVICDYDTEVDECKNRTIVCLNGGTCSDTENTAARCSCSASTTGRVCETDLLDQCASSPCRKAGTCNDLNFGYTCTCSPGWTGTNCQKATNACDSNPCERGQNCEKIANGYKCTCGGGPCNGVSSIEPAALDMTLIASVLASSSVLCALLAATILFVRRWKNKRAMRQMAEAESRRRSAMDLYDAGLTEPQTSATPAGETASPLPPDTSAKFEPEGNSPSNSSTDSSIDSAEFNR